ncbi:MAG: hypothetical protein WC128_07510, partial [Bacteroidales bacterium]
MGITGQKTIEVGILKAPALSFTLDGDFGDFSGDYTAYAENGKIRFQDETGERFVFRPNDPKSSFVLKDVVIG